MSDEFDSALINELKELMEDDFVVLLEAFISDSKDKVVELRAAVGQKDAEEIRKLAHSLKGSSANLGASTLSEFCFTMEKMGRDAELSEIDSVMQHIEKAHATASDYYYNMIAAQNH